MDRSICVQTAGIELTADFRCADASVQVKVQTSLLTAHRFKESLAEHRRFHELPDFLHRHDRARDRLHARGIWEFY